jgi:D-alanine-D-alanine ligase-like ATP-grasp enzyme
MSKHVAVLMGGWSSERPVSLNSGHACADALEGQGFRVTRVDVQPDIATVLTELRPDVAFNALHGPARTAPSRGCWSCCASPTRIPACSPRRWRCIRNVPK